MDRGRSEARRFVRMGVTMNTRRLDRRGFLKALAIGAAAAAVPFGCGGGEETGATGGAGQTETPRSDTRPARVRNAFTASDPGAWDGKQDSHVPQATISRVGEAGGYRIHVVTAHEMVPEHHIVSLTLMDQDGRELATEDVWPTEGAEQAEATFELELNTVSKLYVFSLCNLHGDWINDYIVPA